MTEEDHLWAEYYEGIDQRLNEVRPPRSNQADREWREPVYGWARNHIPNESHLVRVFAERVVDNRETQASKRGNPCIRSPEDVLGIGTRPRYRPCCQHASQQQRAP